MSASIRTILVIGGTSGLGEAFAKRFLEQGKKVIVTGRREDRLKQLRTLGMQTYKWDNTDLAAIPRHLETLFAEHPDIDTVWVNSGAGEVSDIKDLTSSTDEKVMYEITLNLTAPVLIARNVIPRLLARGSESTFMITSSALGFVPYHLFPVYNATKAAVHQYLVSIRQRLKDTKVNIIEIVPPYIATDFDGEWRGKMGPVTPMPLGEFLEDIFAILDSTPAKDIKEVAAGSAVGRVAAWRSSIGEMLANSGLGG